MSYWNKGLIISYIVYSNKNPDLKVVVNTKIEAIELLEFLNECDKDNRWTLGQYDHLLDLESFKTSYLKKLLNFERSTKKLNSTTNI